MASHHLSYYMKRAHNNIDLMRLIMAIIVIIHHAPTISKIESPLLSNYMLGFHVGDSALAFLFFVSGLVITNSFRYRPSLIYYFSSRFFRIWPGLACVLVVSAFIFGPLVTHVEWSEYFSDRRVYEYIRYYLTMGTRELPYVFEDNPYNQSMNGSLWTIKWELKAYIALFVLLYSCFYKKEISRIVIIFLFLCLMLSGVADKQLFSMLYAKTFIVLFFFGSMCCLLDKYIKINVLSALLSLVFLIITIYLKFSLIFQMLATSLVYMHIAFYPLILKIKPKHDISYGVYIWAFPIARMIAYYLPNLTLAGHIILTIIVSITVGYLSWIYIESPSMNYGKNISLYLTDRYNTLRKKLPF